MLEFRGPTPSIAPSALNLIPLLFPMKRHLIPRAIAGPIHFDLALVTFGGA